MAQPQLRLGVVPFTRRDFLRSWALGSLGWALGGCSQRGPHLNFYNWSLFVGPTTLADFEKATGIEVNYEQFSSADVLYAKIKIGVTGYDLIVSPDYLVHRMARQNLLRRFPEAAPRDALIQRFQSPPWDPNLEYSFPYLWGTTGVAYQKDKIPSPTGSWDLLWDQHLKGRITILDEKRDAIGAALIHLGYPGNSTDPSHLEAAKRSLFEQKLLLRKYSSDLVADLVRRETWAALAWSGDTHQAQLSNDEIGFYIPREGSFFYSDNLCLPQTGKNLREAMEFIKFYAQPEVAAGVTNGTGYATPIAAALPLIEAKLRQDPVIYPDEETLKRCVFQQDLGQGERLWDELWEELKR